MSEHRSAADHYRAYGPATKAIHAGFRPDPATGAVNAPIYASSTFAQDGVGGLRGGFEYARTGNPTRAALEASLAAVEEAAFGAGVQLRDGRHRLRAARAAAARRPRRHPGRRLRRHLPAHRQGVHAVGDRATRAVALSDLDAVRAAITDRNQADLGRDADQPAAVHRRHRGDRRSWRPRRTQRCWWTTPLPRRRCSSRCRSVPTSCCTRRPSTSAGTPTWSAARC